MNLNQRGQQAEQVSAPRERGVPLADGRRQVPLWTVEPKQPAQPKCYLELVEDRRREREEYDAMLDAWWAAEPEDEEPTQELEE